MLSLLSLLKRYRELLLSMVLLLVPFGLFIAKGHKVRQPNAIDRAIIAISSPIQASLTRLVDGASTAWKGYVWLRGVHQENIRLKEENSRLSGQLNELIETRGENARLRKLLNVSEGMLAQPLFARVVGVAPDPNNASVRINRGENEGVFAGMAVVTAEGVVGQVQRATGWYADVVLLSDPRSKVAVRVQRTRTRALVTADERGKRLQLEYALRNEALEEGDAVVTSGTDGIFPPGLLVGKLRNVARQGQGPFLTADVEPAVDVSKLEEVFVLPKNAPPFLNLAPPSVSAQVEGWGGPTQ